MTSLDRSDEVFIWRLDGSVRVLAGEKSLIRSNEAIFIGVAKENGRLLGCDLTNGLPLCVQAVSAAVRHVIRSCVLLVLGQSGTNPEVGRTVLEGTV